MTKLWVTDDELIKEIGAPRDVTRQALEMLDRDRSKGFPQKQGLWGGRRYMPAVREYFDRVYGLKMAGEREGRHGPAQAAAR